MLRESTPSTDVLTKADQLERDRIIFHQNQEGWSHPVFSAGGQEAMIAWSRLSDEIELETSGSPILKELIGHLTLAAHPLPDSRPPDELVMKGILGFQHDRDVPDHLQEAVNDLAQVRQAAVEDGWPEPNDEAVRNAENLLHFMYDHFPQRFSVYPGHRGGVCIHAHGGKWWSFLVICENDGGALFSANRPIRSWQVRLSEAQQARRSGLLLKALHDNQVGPVAP